MGTATQIHEASKGGDAASLTSYLAYWDGNSESKEVLNWRSKDGSTCLQAAVTFNRVPCVELLVGASPAVDVNYPAEDDAEDDDEDDYYSTDLAPLHIACRDNRVEIVRVLASAPAIKLNEPTSSASDYETPLHLAAHNGHVEVVRFLVGLKKIRLMTENKDKKTALDHAISSGHDDMVALLREAIEKQKALNAKGLELFRAAHAGNLVELQKLADKWSGNEEVLNWALYDREGYDETYNADVGLQGAMRVSSVMIAVRQGHLEAVRLLLATPGVDPRGQVCPDSDFNILMIAAARGHLEVLRLLLRLVPDIDANCMAEDGQTALVLAIANNHVEIVKELLPLVDVNKADRNGMTGLMFAGDRGNVHVARLLLACPDIDVNFIGGGPGSEETALDYSIRGGSTPDHEEITAMLREKGGKEADELIIRKESEGHVVMKKRKGKWVKVVRYPLRTYARRKTWELTC